MNTPSLFKNEKDSIVFLGLMAAAYANFDFQVKHQDNELTHSNGLNIFSCIIDNSDGEVLALKKNNIHLYSSPLKHSEQLSLAHAIEKVCHKRARIKGEMSFEKYYRSKLFNDPDSTDNLNTGSTLYTTLEPCPFCTSAILVTRMKRTVYVIPDSHYGSSFACLKSKYYAKYDMAYEKLNLENSPNNKLLQFSQSILLELMNAAEELKKNNPNLLDTLILDYILPILEKCHTFFLNINHALLKTKGIEKEKNVKTLETMKKQIIIEP